MSSKTVFTICAKNYIGLAQTLEKSVLKYNPEIDFFIFVVDSFNEDKVKLPQNVLLCENVLGFKKKEWDDLSFKYTLTEFATSLKPFCFKYLFHHEGTYEKVIYLDPDIYLFNSIETIFKKLQKYSIVLTPHINEIEENYTGDYNENLFLGAGTFNLGFLALKKDENSIKMLKWWGKKLLTECYVDNFDNTASDQKWINLLPSFFDSDDLCVDRHLGLNVAPWNYHEREIIMENDNVYVRKRNVITNKKFPLIFIHFSNYDYNKMLVGEIKHQSLAHKYDDLTFVLKLYIHEIQNSNFKKFKSLNYSYNYFNNGTPVSKFNRRLYRALTERGEEIAAPFDTGKNSFYCKLKNKRLITKTNIDRSRQSGFDDWNKSTKIKKNKLGLIVFYLFLKFIKKIIGIQRYIFFLAVLSKYCRYEKQIFLLKKNM